MGHCTGRATGIAASVAAYNHPTQPERPAVFSRDTTADDERRQIAIWRAMSTVELADLVAGASEAARALAIAGLRTRHPDLSDEALLPRCAALACGPDLAARACPQLRHRADSAT